MPELEKKVTTRSNGKLIDTGAFKSLNEAMPGAELAIMRYSNIEGFEDKNIINREQMTMGDKDKEGFTLAIVPVNKNRDNETSYLALPMERQRLRPEAITSVVKSVEIFMESLIIWTVKHINSNGQKPQQN